MRSGIVIWPKRAAKYFFPLSSQFFVCVCPPLSSLPARGGAFLFLFLATLVTVIEENKRWKKGWFWRKKKKEKRKKKEETFVKGDGCIPALTMMAEETAENMENK